MRRLANMKPGKPRRPRPITFFIRCQVKKDGRWHVAKCLNLPVSTQDSTQADALENLGVAIRLFVEGCLARGTLAKFIDEHGWRPSLTPPESLPKGIVVLPVTLPEAVRRYLEKSRS